MKMTQRDKILACLVPAIIVIAVYGLFFLRGKLSERERVSKALMDAVAKSPSHSQIAAQRMELSKVKAETEAIEGRLKSLQKKWTYEAAFCASGPNRHDRVQKLTYLLNKHHLVSLDDSEVTAAKDGRVSVSLESVAERLSQLPGTQKPQLRRIRFHGRFIDVHRALDELAAGEMLGIPVGLTMKTTEETDRREWTLLVWL